MIAVTATQAARNFANILDRVERGETIVIVTHDPRIADQCSRIVHIVDGRVEQDSARS